MKRREFIKQLSQTAAAIAAVCDVYEPNVAAANGRQRMGVASTSYSLRWRGSSSDRKIPQFRSALDFLEHCHAIGAGGIQAGFGNSDADLIRALRAKAESWEMYLEAEVRLPRDATDVERFATQIRAAKEAGATVARTVCLGGRRYEQFDTAEAFKQFAVQSWESLRLAEPIVKKHRVRLAVENHKDWLVSELLDLLQRLTSEWVGACVDFGNNIALLEGPLELVEALAPWAFSTHVKDMAMQEYADGVLLSEVPLGEGILDLRRMIEVLRRAKPDIRWNLEMITRDPLKVPCLTRKYWATFDAVPARELAATLATVRTSAPKKPLPQTTGRGQDENLRQEEENVLKSFAHARERLGI